MFRLLGILMAGDLLFGGRHARRHYHRHAVRRGLLFGALLGWLAAGNSDTERVRREAREAARNARDAVRAARRDIRSEAREAARSARDAVRAARDEIRAARYGREAEPVRTEPAAPVNPVRALPNAGTKEAREIGELVEDMARNAGTAAMAAGVPTIDFPETEDGKYHAARKYEYE